MTVNAASAAIAAGMTRRDGVDADARVSAAGNANRVVDLRSIIGRRLESSLAIFRQTPLQQSADRCRRGGRQEREVRLAVENRGEGVGDGVFGERRAACEHLVEHAAERPDVDPPVQRLATCLFRAHVGRRAQNRPLVQIRCGTG
jgi:hypothetical protein